MEHFTVIFLGALVGNLIGSLLWDFFKGGDK